MQNELTFSRSAELTDWPMSGSDTYVCIFMKLLTFSSIKSTAAAFTIYANKLCKSIAYSDTEIRFFLNISYCIRVSTSVRIRALL